MTANALLEFPRLRSKNFMCINAFNPHNLPWEVGAIIIPNSANRQLRYKNIKQLGQYSMAN